VFSIASASRFLSLDLGVGGGGGGGGGGDRGSDSGGIIDDRSYW